MPRRSNNLLLDPAHALAWAIPLLLGACSSPAEEVRGDLDLALPLPPTPEVSTAFQFCETDADCLLVHGGPGQTLEGLCCATCEAPLAVNLSVAADIARWKKGLDCRKVACRALPECGGASNPTRALCEAGPLGSRHCVAK